MLELRPTCCCCNSTGILHCAAFQAKTPQDVARKEEEEEFQGKRKRRNFKRELPWAGGVKQGEPEASARPELTPLAGTRQTRCGQRERSSGTSSWTEQGFAGWMQPRAAEKASGSRKSVVMLWSPWGEHPAVPWPPCPVRLTPPHALRASVQCSGTQFCTHGTVKIAMPGDFCLDYFRAWDSPVHGSLQQQGRAPLPLSASPERRLPVQAGERPPAGAAPAPGRGSCPSFPASPTHRPSAAPSSAPA